MLEHLSTGSAQWQVGGGLPISHEACPWVGQEVQTSLPPLSSPMQVHAAVILSRDVLSHGAGYAGRAGVPSSRHARKQAAAAACPKAP